MPIASPCVRRPQCRGCLQRPCRHWRCHRRSSCQQWDCRLLPGIPMQWGQHESRLPGPVATMLTTRSIGVAVGVAVSVGVAVGVAVSVGVAVGVAVSVGVVAVGGSGVLVGVGGTGVAVGGSACGGVGGRRRGCGGVGGRRRGCGGVGVAVAVGRVGGCRWDRRGGWRFGRVGGCRWDRRGGWRLGVLVGVGGTGVAVGGSACWWVSR